MREIARSFVENAGWGAAAQSPVAGDLSSRSYTRLTRAEGSAILMDAGDEVASTKAFVVMTDWLRKIGLSAPRLLSSEPNLGLLLLEDFGNLSVTNLLANGQESTSIFATCIELLLAIRNQPKPGLIEPTAQEMAQWTFLADTYYPGADTTFLDDVRAVLETEMAQVSIASSVSLRDFHADNLMWLPGRDGIRKLGLLDYQDAFLTHPVYDLVSLLTDARMDVCPEMRRTYLRAYATESGDDFTNLEKAFAVYSVQRNLRILGIFHRAAKEFGKRHHLPKLPRVYEYVIEAFEHPIFSDLSHAVTTALPPPEITP